MPSMSVSPVSRRIWPLALAAIAACAGGGCTTVLSTASLRDFVLGIDDRIDDSTLSSPADESAPTGSEGTDAADAERRVAAIEEATSRLSKLEGLDDAARATLVATLQRTDQEDWPVVVDAFAESLASSPAPHVVAKADLDTASERDRTTASPPHAVPTKSPEDTMGETSREPDAEQAATQVPAPTGTQAPAPLALAPAPPVAAPIALAVATTVAPIPEAEPAPEPEVTPSPATSAPATTLPATLPPPAPTLTIRNASFASRVQAWGVLDRFAADRFRPGQEVIVYFELENLSAGESEAGHTTCIDSRIRLVTAEGDTVHEWTFEPIAETCRARRHDYFARYVIRIPAEAKPGRHRIELGVTDTLSGQLAVEAVDFDVLATATAAN